MKIWRLEGARQAKFGIGPVRDFVPWDGFPAKFSPASVFRPDALGQQDGNLFVTLVSTFDYASASVEYGRGVEIVGEIPADSTYEQQFDALAKLGEWDESWAEQQARLRGYEEEEEEEEED